MAARISSARRGPSASDSGVAAIRTTTSSASISSRSTRGSLRTGVRTTVSITAWTWLGLTSGRSRARRSMPAGSLSGTTAADITIVFGTRIESSPWAKVV